MLQNNMLQNNMLQNNMLQNNIDIFSVFCKNQTMNLDYYSHCTSPTSSLFSNSENDLDQMTPNIKTDFLNDTTHELDASSYSGSESSASRYKNTDILEQNYKYCEKNIQQDVTKLRKSIHSIEQNTPPEDFGLSMKVLKETANSIQESITLLNINKQQMIDQIMCNITTSHQQTINLTTEKIKQLLNNMFANSEISYFEFDKNQHVDIINFKRPNKKNIIIQIFHDENNILQNLIDSFVYFLNKTNSNGIMVSKNSCFHSKPDFHIDNCYGNSIIYINSMENDLNKIRLAINTTDTIMTKMIEYEKNNNDYTIEKILLNEVYNEFQQFLTEKEHLIESLKEEHKRVINQLQHGFKFSMLESLLTTKMSKIPKKEGIKCTICNNYCAHNLKALSAHKRGCSKKNTKITPSYEVNDFIP